MRLLVLQSSCGFPRGGWNCLRAYSVSPLLLAQSHVVEEGVSEIGQRNLDVPEAAQLPYIRSVASTGMLPTARGRLGRLAEGLAAASQEGCSATPSQWAASSADHDGLVRRVVVILAGRYRSVSASPRSFKR
jgi:hypothetical protein